MLTPTLLAITEQGELIELKINKIIWHLYMKLYDTFDQTPPHILDKIVAKLVPMKRSIDLKA